MRINRPRDGQEGRQANGEQQPEDDQRDLPAFDGEIDEAHRASAVRRGGGGGNLAPSAQPARAGGEVGRLRVGVAVARGGGCQACPDLLRNLAPAAPPEGRSVAYALFNKLSAENFRAAREAEQELHMTGAHLAAHFDMEGPNFTCLTACAASSPSTGPRSGLH